MSFTKPNKAQRNEQFYAHQLSLDATPYHEEIENKKKQFLIICEGKNTEPHYFEAIPVPSKTVIIEGGRNTKSKLLEYALSQQKLPKYEDFEIWCVFDFDIKPDEAATQPQDFNDAIKKAIAANLKVAWSNDAFELWFVLHYQLIEANLSRKELNGILKKHWELRSFHNQAKKERFSKNLYQLLGGTKSAEQQEAIKQAIKLHNAYGTRMDFSNHCPCTTVYLLVEELNNNLKQ